MQLVKKAKLKPPAPRGRRGLPQLSCTGLQYLNSQLLPKQTGCGAENVPEDVAKTQVSTERHGCI